MSFQGYKEVFSVPGFSLALLARFFTHLGKQMRSLIVSWQVYQLTADPLALGYLGLAEALPYISVVLWVGHEADQRGQKKITYLRAVFGHLLCSLALLLFSLRPGIPLGWLYCCVAIAGIFTSYDTVVFSAYYQSFIPSRIYPRAAAWNISLFQLAVISGPLLGGFLLAHANLSVAYLATACLLAVSISATAFLSEQQSKTSAGDESSWQSIVSGIRFILSERIIFAAMMLDMLGVLFGDVVAILPIFAEMLGVGALGLGVLRAAPAVGSFVMAQFQTLYPVFRTSWSALLRAVTVFGLAIICFALSDNFVLSVILLGISGMADNVSIIIRHSIYQAFTPEHLRGRVSSINGIFIRTSNEIGAFESGLAAKLLGTVPSVIFGGGVTLAVCALMRWKYPRLEGRPISDDDLGWRS